MTRTTAGIGGAKLPEGFRPGRGICVGVTVSLLLLSCVLSSAFAQSIAPGYIDPKPVLNAANEAIGADRVNCLTVAGSAYAGRVGQERYVKVEGDWPIDRLTNFVRTMNWQAGAMREEFDRPPGLTPASFKYGAGWTGGTPLQRHTRQMFAVKGGVAWHRDGPDGELRPIAPDTAAMWQLDLWLNPIGFLKAAALPGADPIATWRWELGESGRDGPTTAPQKVSVVSIEVLGKYRVDATINQQNLIQRIHTRVAHPVLGDFNVEQEFSNQDYIELPNGSRFPTKWHSHQGYDDNYNTQTVASGHNAFGGDLSRMEVNACSDLAAPAGLPRFADPARVESQKLAEGVYLLGGSTHNSVAIEFKNYIAVVEAPLSEARSIAVIAEVVRLFPGKPIRYLVNTHQHFDHIGGLRTYAHIGATVITHARNYNFYNRDVVNYTPRQMEPDLVSLMPPTEITEGYNYELVRENYTLTDGQRIAYLNYVQPLKEAEGMLMVYLPGERLLIEADMVNTHEPLVADGSDGARVLYNMVKTLDYTVDRIVPIHGLPVAWDVFVSATGVNQ